jgi:hypothetical protein
MTEQDQNPERQEEPVEDLEVEDARADEVRGGSGSSGGDMPTESISLNFKK